MPPEDHVGRYENKSPYDHCMNPGRKPRRFYTRNFRRHHGFTKSEPDIVDDYSEERPDMTPAASWRGPAYGPMRRGFMSPKQCGRITGQEMAR